MIGEEDAESPAHVALLSSLELHNLTVLEIPAKDGLPNTLQGVCHLLSEGILGLFSTSLSPILSATASIFDVPYCTTTRKEEGRPNGFTTGMGRKHWRKLLRDIMEQFDHSAVALLYEGRECLSQLQTLLEEPSPIGRVFVRSLENPVEAMRQVRDRVRTIFVCSSLSMVPYILRKAVQLDMRDHHYFLTNLDTQRLDLSEYSNVNFTIFRFVPPNYTVMNFLPPKRLGHLFSVLTCL